MKNKSLKVLLLHNRVRSERHLLFEEIANKCPFDVAYLENYTKNNNIDYKYNSHYLDCKKLVWYFISPFRLIKLIKKYDVIITDLDYRMIFVNFVLFLNKRRLKLKIINWYGEFDSKYFYSFSSLKLIPSIKHFIFLIYKNFFIDLLNRYFIINSDSFISYCEKSDKYLIEKYNQPREKIFSGCQYINLKINKPKIYSDSSILKLVFLGRLIKLKGIQNMIEVIRNHKYSHNIELSIIGVGNYKNYLVKLSKGLNVKFLGFKSGLDKEKILRNSDIFIFPTYFDAWGFVINEAMAQGLPIICSNEAGASDLVNENGLLFDVTDLIKVDKFITKVYESRDLLNGMSKKSISIIKKNQLNRSIKVFLDSINYVSKK